MVYTSSRGGNDNMRILLLILFGFVTGRVLSAGPLTDDDFNSAEFEQQLDNFIRAGLACHDNPALTVSVVRHGRTVLAKGYGHTTTDKVTPVSNRTLFGIASLSKAFAATLILKLIEENSSVSLDTKIRDLLGDEVFGDDLRTKYTTLEDLLSHRVGIPSNNKVRLDDTVNRSNVAGRIKFLKAEGGFRTSFMYSNIMYGLLTHIAELLGNDTWENLVRDRIFRPLGMTSSTFATTIHPTSSDLAQGYESVYDRLSPVALELSRRWGELCGSGCILSNAVDMAKWLQFHLNGGMSADNNRVLESSLHDLMFMPENIVKSSRSYYSRPVWPETRSFAHYGLGWRLGQYRGLPFIAHTGSTYGYRAMASLMPDMNISVFVGLTGDDPSYLFRTNIHLYALDLLLNETPWLSKQTVCSFPGPWEQEMNTPHTSPRKDIPLQRTVTDYEGTYSNPAYGKIMISGDSSSKQLRMLHGFGEFVLYPKYIEDEAAFFAEAVGIIRYVMDISEIRFDLNGSTPSFVIPSYAERYPPVFRKASDRTTHRQHSGTSGSCAVIDMTLVFVMVIVSVRSNI